MPTYAHFDDQYLVSLLAQGDEAAFTEIYNRYWEKLFAISYNYCKQKPLAEEIVQDIFMGLWTRRNSIQITSLSAYLATAAKFSVFKTLLKEKRRKELIKEAIAPVISITEDEKINSRFLKEFIHGIVEQLPEKCRIIFYKSRFAQYTIPEIADELNISTKTVESHLTKAIKFVRLSLSDAHIWLLMCLFLDR